MSIVSVFTAPYRWLTKVEREFVADVKADFHKAVARLDAITDDIEDEFVAIETEVRHLLGRQAQLMKDHVTASALADAVHGVITDDPAAQSPIAQAPVVQAPVVQTAPAVTEQAPATPADTASPPQA